MEEKAKSISKYGLEEIVNALLNPWYKERFDILKSCHVLKPLD